MHLLGRSLLALVAAFVLVGASATVQRVGGQAVYNNECRLAWGEAACLVDQEVAGLPFAFLIDTPGVSVEHLVSMFEDRFRPAVFVMDVALVWAVLLGVIDLVRRQTRAAQNAS